jgi:hypothetical protein
MKRNKMAVVLLLVLGALAIWLYLSGRNTGRTAENLFAQFAIADTSLVTKIVITDSRGETATLERDPNDVLWDLNRTYKARKDAVDLLLKTFKRVQVKAPVSEVAKENVLRMMAASGKMVEIYTGGAKPQKIWYIGTPTPDHFGTHMLLEIPGKGKSEEPYVMHMSGFSGILNTRFFTDEQDWRYTGLFRYPGLEFKRIRLENKILPAAGFTVDYGGGNDIRLSDFTGRSISDFDTMAVKDFLLVFKRVHLESHVSGLSRFSEDSVLTKTPDFVLTITPNSGDEQQLSIYRKRMSEGIHDMYGYETFWDLDRHYATTDGRDLFVIQSFVFNPIMIGIDKFRKGRNPQDPGYLWYLD